MSLAVTAIDALGLPHTWLVPRVWRALLLLVAGWGAVRLLLLAEQALLGRQAGDGRGGVRGQPVPGRGRRDHPVLVLRLYLAAAHPGPGGADPGSWPGRPPSRWSSLMTGMNSRGGPVRRPSPCLLLYLRLTERTAWRRLLGPALRCAGLAALISLYWLVPAAMAGETGEAVAAFLAIPRTWPAPPPMPRRCGCARRIIKLAKDGRRGPWTVLPDRPAGR